MSSDDESEAGDTENDQGFVLIANEILQKCKIDGEVKSLTECLDSYFVAIYEGILGEPLVGVITNVVSDKERVENCNSVIDALSHDVLNVDLSHITGENIVAGDVATVQNLLEIFKELLDFILDVDDEFDMEDDDDNNDSNLLLSDHEVISDILQKELGPFSHGRNARFSSTDSSIIHEPEVSSIPKCSDVILSSRSSDVDSNSTDEIIRESELLERQLSREYPLLHQKQALDEHNKAPTDFEHLKYKYKEKLLKDRKDTTTFNLPTSSQSVSLRNDSGLSALSVGCTTIKDNKMEVKDTKANQANDDREAQFCEDNFRYERNSGSLGGISIPITGRSHGVSEAVDMVQGEQNGLIRNIGVHRTAKTGDRSQAKDKVPSVHGGTIRDTIVHGGTSRDTVVPKSQRLVGISEAVERVPSVHKSTIMDKSVPKTGKLNGSSKKVDTIHRLLDGHRKPVTIPTGLVEQIETGKDSDGLTRASKDIRGSIETREDSDNRENVRGQSALSKNRTQGEENYRSRHLKNWENGKPSAVRVSLHAQETKDDAVLGAKSGVLSQEGTTVYSSDVKRTDGGKKSDKNSLQSRNLRTSDPKTTVSKTRATSKETSKGYEKPVGFEEYHRRSKVVEKTFKAKSQSSTSRIRGVNRGVVASIEHSNGRKNSRENKRPPGGLRDQRGSRLHNSAKDGKVRQEERGDIFTGRRTMEYKDGRRSKGGIVEQEGARATNGDNGRFEKTRTAGASGDIKEHTDGSDTSGVFWDDQISPLDISERLRNPGQGLAFDEVGLSKKTPKYEPRQGLGKSKDSRDSPVVRHYHHHFHHGSSEDLVRDVDLSERALGKQRDGQGLGSSFGKSESRSQHHVPCEDEGLVKKDKTTSKKRSVKFDDHVDTLLITNRLERLRKEMEIEDKKENERRLQIRNGYSGYLGRLNKEHRRAEKRLKRVSKKTKRPSPYSKKRGVSIVSRDRTRSTNQKKARYPSSKARKCSTSCSPKIRHKKKAAKQLEKGDIILPTLLDEFPYLHLSPHTLQTMRRKQTTQLLSLSKTAPTSQQRQTKTQKVIEDAEKRQQTLLKILRKDLQYNQRMREQKERKEQERAIQSKLREKRHATARARRYYEDYQLRMRARMLKRRTKEEQIFKNLFEDGLEIQKRRVHELRSYAKEQREMRAVRQQDELESLENYYRDQYSLLTEAIAQEKESLLVREKAQEKVIHEMQRNLRGKLQKEVTDIQETIVRNEDDAYFRRLDAERLQRQLQMTAFQNLS